MNVMNYIQDFEEMDSYEREELVGETINEIVRTILATGKEANPTDKERLKKILIKKSYAKVLARVVKSREYDIDLTLAVVLSDILVEGQSDEEGEEISDLVKDLFYKIIEILITKKTNHICKSTRIARPIVTNLILECPDDLNRECVPMGQRYYFINRVINKFYYLPDIIEANNLNFDYNDIDRNIKMVKEIIGEENLSKFAINILLEPRSKFERLDESQITVWNLLTRMALTIIDDLDIVEQRGSTRKTICNAYIKRREIFAKKSPDGEDVPRRIDLTTINSNHYPAIGRAIEDILDRFEDSITKYLK